MCSSVNFHRLNLHVRSVQTRTVKASPKPPPCSLAANTTPLPPLVISTWHLMLLGDLTCFGDLFKLICTVYTFVSAAVTQDCVHKTPLYHLVLLQFFPSRGCCRICHNLMLFIYLMPFLCSSFFVQVEISIESDFLLSEEFSLTFLVMRVY